jgi:hypothetical protein
VILVTSTGDRMVLWDRDDRCAANRAAVDCVCATRVRTSTT